jgi:hypothetical protein
MKYRNKYIWSQDCIAICTLLGLALDDKQISKICSKHDLQSSEDKPDTFYGFYQLHKSCHKEGGVIPKRLTKMLNERYAGIIRAVRRVKCDIDVKYGGNKEINNKLKKWIDRAPEGVIWALLTDSRQSFQHHGVYLVHQISYTAFRDACRKNEFEENNADALEAAQHELQQCRKRLLEKNVCAENLRKKLIEAEQSLTSLQVACDRQQKRILELEKKPEREKQLRRRIRMLEHELAQTCLDEVLNSKRTDNKPNISVETTNQLCENQTIHCSFTADKSLPNDSETSKQSDCSSCSLDNLRVAVIGGLDRLEPHYRRVIEGLGAQFCFHNGDCHGGRQALKNIIHKSDIIMFITRVNSHTALHVVRGLCRKTGKRFTVLRETSPRALAKALPKTA